MKKEQEKHIWENLLSCKRVNNLLEGSVESECRTEPRNHFERDCDRITFSYPFRRLQDKTQVIPLPTIDFVHSRLTHTLEVATVGRSFGKLLENYLFEKQIIDYDKFGDIPAIVRAACLAHDIGNPPFGHSGEDSISEYFSFTDGQYYLTKQYGGGMLDVVHEGYKYVPYKNVVSQIKCTDLKKFEGNANGFRILTRLNGSGLNLSCATLAAFTKYPRPSYVEGEIENERWVENRVSQKKYGFFYSERKIFEKVAEEVGLIKLKSTENYNCYARHPLAFLMEAADDICYRIIDVEDGYRIGRIPFSELEKLLLYIASKDERFNKKKYESISTEKIKLIYLRARAMNYLIFQTFDVFKNNYNQILSGEFDSELIKEIGDKESLNYFKQLKDIISKYVYNWDEVLLLETSGFQVLSGLCEEFVEALNICLDCPDDSISKRALKVYNLLPFEYKHFSDREELYHKYLKIADYVAGMSDSYALNLYRRIKGVN